ncbi:5,6-dimethylbenzimidazole synthase [Herbaspirillum sp. LeCh32-8]|nr:5,6-dimethylbenzimidazole synthase [Herbaspirillum sp. LeCh32-8]
MSPHRYPQAEVEAVYRAIRERRDMRHFLPDAVDPALLERLLQAAHHAPSVGFMQPWRFIRIRAADLRTRIHALVEQGRIATAQALGEREDEFMKLKVEGILDCGELLVAALMERREPHVFGRRTMPQMDLASLACALQNMWLAARVEGLGMGWVSLFEPAQLAQLLEMPEGAEPVAVVCLGHVPAFYEKPMLEQQNWAARRPLHELVADDKWPSEPAGDKT